MPRDDVTQPVLVTCLVMVLLAWSGHGPPWYVLAFIVLGGFLLIVEESR